MHVKFGSFNYPSTTISRRDRTRTRMEFTHKCICSGTPELPPPQPGGMLLPDGTDLRNVTVLSKAEWDRIEQELNRRQIEEERAARAKREYEEQKKKSKELVKTWGNTLAVSKSRSDLH